MGGEPPTRVRGGAILGGIGGARPDEIGEVTEYVLRKAPSRVLLTAPPEEDEADVTPRRNPAPCNSQAGAFVPGVERFLRAGACSPAAVRARIAFSLRPRASQGGDPGGELASRHRRARSGSPGRRRSPCRGAGAVASAVVDALGNHPEVPSGGASGRVEPDQALSPPRPMARMKDRSILSSSTGEALETVQEGVGRCRSRRSRSRRRGRSGARGPPTDRRHS